jgi:general secretion pathway protein A
MYLDYYHLKKAPFHITPDPEFLFLSPSHKAALGSIIYGIEERQGFVAISGEVGLGKTTILRSYLERIDQSQLKTIYIFNANVSFRGLLKSIFGEFGLDYESDDLFEMVNRLHQVLIEEYKQGRNVALIIDEAQNMPVETLENLRMLSNLETNTEKLVQIVLIGQPEFDHKLNLNELRQLKQRLAIRSTIEPLTGEESLAYIHHRLAKVALTDEPIFTKGALKQIIETAKGTPRVLNILCTNALIAGFGYRQKPITARTVKGVIVDFAGQRRLSRLKPALAFSAVTIACASILWTSPYRHTLLDELYQTGPFQSVTEVLRGLQGKESSYVNGSQTDLVSTEKPVIEPLLTENHTQGTMGYHHASTLQSVNFLENDEDFSFSLPQTIDTYRENGLNAHDSSGTLEEKDSNKDAEVVKEALRKDSFPVVRTIKKGDYISKLAVEIYGFTNNKVIETLKEHNPQIHNMNKIEVGDHVLFPDLHIPSE